jgi:hypothetical protein
VLAADTDVPPVAQAPVGPDLLEALDVVAELRGDVLREDLRVLPCLDVLLPVQEPERDLELARVLDDGHELLDLVGGKLAGPLVDAHLSLLADEIGEPPPNPTDLCQSKDDISFPFDVSVEDTKNVLELGSLHQRRRPAVYGRKAKGT